uniref:Transmembrane protein 44 n=1 Tax=Castor canadensis TaxID=51338 RepID=A0A8C0XJZ2_CASCN
RKAKPLEEENNPRALGLRGTWLQDLGWSWHQPFPCSHLASSRFQGPHGSLVSPAGRGTRERKRRRRLRASVFALILPLSLGPGWALWAAVPKASAPVQGPQRRLLGSLLQENTEVLGYLLGGIAAFGSWASRIPPFSRIVRLGWGWGCGSHGRS